MELLNKLYYDPKIGFHSQNALYKKAKAIDSTITQAKVKEFLQNQATQQITKPAKKNKVFDTIISPSVRNNYQMDIMYLPFPAQNKNFKYLLTCIDVYSRFAFVIPLKNKQGDDVFHAFKIMITKYGKPKNLNVDVGSEFTYKPFKEFCEKNNITLFFSNPEQENKNSIIERFHRTLRNLLLKYSIATDKAYINVLQTLVSNYNNTHHSTIDATPISIWNKENKNRQRPRAIFYDFKVGDKVRHRIKHKVFDKASSNYSYTKKVFTITKIDKKAYYLDDLKKTF